MRMKLGEPIGSSQPKLTLTKLPSHHKATLEPPGLITPPLFPMASVPFQWEEAPGRPRFRPNRTLSPSPISKPKSARLLELPPRVVSISGKVADLPSPTTVLDGVEEDRASSCIGGGAGEEVVEVKAKITRLRRRGSFFSSPHRHCQLLLDSIYGSLKQVMLRGRYSSDKRR